MWSTINCLKTTSNIGMKIKKPQFYYNHRMNFSNFNQTFAKKAAGQSKLKQFYKYTHPDLLGKAPAKVRDTNLKSIQELNEYLQNVSNPLNQNALQGKELTFYINTNNQPEKESSYQQFDFELLPLKQQASTEVKNMHYTNTVDSLLSALEQTMGSEEELKSQKQEMEDSYGARFSTKINWDQVNKPVKKPQKLMEEYQEAAFYYQMEQYADSRMMNASRNQILWNVYREFYDIPKDLYVRKADPLMKLAVFESEAYKRANTMRENSINPSLIFFSNELQEHQIQKTVEILQGDKINEEKQCQYFKLLQETNFLLVSSNPQLYLMFMNQTHYTFDQIPGYFGVPYKFEPKELMEYVKTLAIKFVNGQKDFDNALESLRKVIPNLQISRKDEKDFRIDRYALATRHLLKYLDKQYSTYNGKEIDRRYLLLTIVEATPYYQIVFGKKFQVFKDLTVEIPKNFKDEDLDEFIYEIDQRGIMKQEEQMKQKMEQSY